MLDRICRLTANSQHHNYAALLGWGGGASEPNAIHVFFTTTKELSREIFLRTCVHIT